MNGRSFFGRPRVWDRKPIGLGVCVSVARPMKWRATMNMPHAMPTLSLA
jgi:hypothetical protein